MKKIKFKRGLCAALALALALCLLPGCGTQGDAGPAGAEGTAAPAEAEGAETQYVYVSSFFPVAVEGIDLDQAAWVDGAFYTSSYEMVADHTPEGVTPEYEGEYWEYGSVLYRVSPEGKAEKLAWEPDRITEEEEGVNGGVYIRQLCAAPEGGILLIMQSYRTWYDGPEDLTREDEHYWDYYQYEAEDTLVALDREGNERYRISLADLKDSGNMEDFYPNALAADGEGNIYCSNERTVYILSPQGELLHRLEAEGWVNNLLATPEGGVLCVYYGGRGVSAALLDSGSTSLEGSKSLNANAQEIFAGNGDYDLCYTNGVSFYGYDLETGESQLLLNWLDCDVDPEAQGSALAFLEDGRILRAVTEWDENFEKTESSIVVLEPRPYDTVPRKETLTLATRYLGSEVRRQVLNFNRKSGKYRIEVKDYSEYNNYNSNDESDYTAGLTKLQTEIGAGNVPDILDLNGLPMDQLAAKGLLEDLYPYLDADPDLDREELIPNVLQALEVGGKLYTTCDYFNIITAVGAASVVGDTPGWSYDAFRAALASMPEGCTAFDRYEDRDEMLNYCLALDGDSFVDWSTGECSFDSEAFCDLLEFVKSFPDTFDWDNYVYDESDGTTSRIAFGRQMLVLTQAGDFGQQQMFRAMFGGDITYIGLPTETGTGNMISAGSGYAMSAKCADKEAAWEFLRELFLSSGKDSDRNYGISIHKDAFERQLAKAMEAEYQKDADGNYVLDENGERIEVSHSSWGWDSLTIDIYAMKPEEADQLRELVYTTTKLYKLDQSIHDIVSEQLPAYFAGEKTVQETAKLIQSKAMIYVNEQR